MERDCEPEMHAIGLASCARFSRQNLPKLYMHIVCVFGVKLFSFRKQNRTQKNIHAVNFSLIIY